MAYEIEEMMKNVEATLRLIVKAYFSRAKELNDSNITSIYDGLKERVASMQRNYQIELEKAKAEGRTIPNKDYFYTRLNNVLDNFIALIRDKKVLEEIKSKRISEGNFIEKYKNILMKDEKRDYDMSEMFNPSLIAQKSQFSMMKALSYRPTEKSQGAYFEDRDGRIVTIMFLGTLKFKTWNGEQDSISKYKIQKANKNSEILLSEDVYSNISIFNMDDVQYRDAVLEELLSDDNILLSNCNGYIGEIELDPKEKEPEGQQLETSTRFKYRIDNKYIISYNSTPLTAVIEYGLEQESMKKKLADIDSMSAPGESAEGHGER